MFTGLTFAEHLAVRAGDLGEVLRAREHDPRPDNVLGGGVHLGQRGERDLEAAVRLAVGVGGRVGVVGHDRRRAGDPGVRADPHHARVAGGFGKRRDGEDGAPFHGP